MDAWIDALRAELGINVNVDVDLVLDVAKDAAHNVERPAAPVSTFLLGVAIAQGQNPNTAAEKISALAKQWSA
jgi:hypothetical protein